MIKEKAVEEIDKFDEVGLRMKKAKQFSRKFFNIVVTCLAIAVVVTIFIVLSTVFLIFISAAFGD